MQMEDLSSRTRLQFGVALLGLKYFKEYMPGECSKGKQEVGSEQRGDITENGHFCLKIADFFLEVSSQWCARNDQPMISNCSFVCFNHASRP